jgi:hypothetical protein
VKFALNTYSIIGNGLEETIKLYRDTVRSISKTPDVQVSIWPFYDATWLQIGYTGFLLRGTRGDVDAVLLGLPESSRPSVQPVIT